MVELLGQEHPPCKQKTIYIKQEFYFIPNISAIIIYFMSNLSCLIYAKPNNLHQLNSKQMNESNSIIKENSILVR